MIELKTMFGYPVVINSLQTNDVLYFNGASWVNVSKDDAFVYGGYSAPITDTNAFTLDGVPTLYNRYMGMGKSLVLLLNTLLSDNMVIAGQTIFAPFPASSIKQGYLLKPTVEYNIIDEVMPVHNTSWLPISDFTVI